MGSIKRRSVAELKSCTANFEAFNLIAPLHWKWSKKTLFAVIEVIKKIVLIICDGGEFSRSPFTRTKFKFLTKWKIAWICLLDLRNPPTRITILKIKLPIAIDGNLTLELSLPDRRLESMIIKINPNFVKIHIIFALKGFFVAIVFLIEQIDF